MVRARLIVSTIVAALGSFLFGFDTAVISGTTEALTKVYHLSSNLLGFTVASALLGTIAGSILVGRPAESAGRKRVLIGLALLYLVSAIGCGLAWSWVALVVFRFFGGLAIGGASVVSPMYIAEISPARSRGRLVAVSQLNVVLGILCAYLSNYLIALATGPEAADSWRWMLGIMAIPAAVFLILLAPVPESPRWLAKQRKRDEALEVLARLGHENPREELQEIVESLHEERVSTAERLFSGRYRQPILLAIMIATFNQLSGINALIYYTPAIFRMGGAGHTGALFQSVIIGLTNLIFTIAAMFVIDRFGRKRLMIVGTLGLTLCLTLASYSFRSSSGQMLLWSLIGYIAFFAFSQGAVIWVYLSEIFPNRVRGRGQAFGSFTHWFWCAIVSWTFPVIAEASSSVAFGFFALMMLLEFVLVLKLMPETKGVSLETIQKRMAIE